MATVDIQGTGVRTCIAVGQEGAQKSDQRGQEPRLDDEEVSKFHLNRDSNLERRSKRKERSTSSLIRSRDTGTQDNF